VDKTRVKLMLRHEIFEEYLWARHVARARVRIVLTKELRDTQSKRRDRQHALLSQLLGVCPVPGVLGVQIVPRLAGGSICVHLEVGKIPPGLAHVEQVSHSVRNGRHELGLTPSGKLRARPASAQQSCDNPSMHCTAALPARQLHLLVMPMQKENASRADEAYSCNE